jgi:hypothetical protein
MPHEDGLRKGEGETLIPEALLMCFMRAEPMILYDIYCLMLLGWAERPQFGGSPPPRECFWSPQAESAR